MTSIKVRLYTYRANKKGTFPLVFQILHQREKRVIYSSYHLHEECFDKAHSRVVSRRREKVFNASEINDYIHNMVGQLETTINMLEDERENYSVADITELFRSHQNNSLVLIYMRKLIVQLKEEKRMSTLDSYQSTYNRLIRFIGKKEDLYFCDITPRWLNRFISSLQKSGLKENTINFYCRILRAVYNRAYNEGVTGTSYDSPFKKVSFGSTKTVKRAIDREAIRQIIHAKIENNKQLEIARDFFLFSLYCRGMSFVDMAYLKHTNIIDGVIYYNRRKTKQPMRVKIVPQLQNLIEKYRRDEEFVLPILSKGDKSLYNKYRSELRKTNKDLNKLSLLLGLEIPLTSYVARHSWATQAHKNGVPVSVISESLGHTSEKMTYIYLAALDPAVVDSANGKISKMYL